MESHDIKKTALEFLNAPDRLTAVIGSSATDGNTHAATVYYYVDNSFNFYFLTANNTQKYRNLTENPNAAIVIGFGPSYTTVQGQGTILLLKKSSEEELEAIAHIKKRLQDHNDETWPIFQLDEYESGSIAVFKLIPQTLGLLNLEKDNQLVVTDEEILPLV
jgi:nitroimidazol reductase NimA-like FMN-containing flavoprotein (pyridoxamine 5'-phosphate oxidase superfamily)